MFNQISRNKWNRLGVSLKINTYQSWWTLAITSSSLQILQRCVASPDHSRARPFQHTPITHPSIMHLTVTENQLVSGARREARARHSPALAEFSDQQEITWELAIWWMLQRVNAGALGADGRVREDSSEQGVLDIKMKWWGAGGTRGREKSSPGGRNSVYKAMTQGKHGARH